jgi:hypothetical protein
MGEKDNIKILLRLEGMVTFILLTLIYYSTGNSLKQFIILFFLPDLSMLGYLVNNRMGSIIYNIGHSYLIPMLIACCLIITDKTNYLYLVYIWVAHIGFDRMLGYGLKYSESFYVTHLGNIKIPFSK